MYSELVTAQLSGAWVQGQPLLRKQEQLVPYLHVTAWVGLDRVLSWKAALHDLIKACIPNVLGKLQKNMSLFQGTQL